MSIDSIRSFFNSSRGNALVRVLVILILALLIFHAGYTLGSNRALSRERVVMMSKSGSFGNLPHSFMIGGHGAIGIVTAVSTSSLDVATKQGTTQIVMLTPHTDVMPLRGATSTAIETGSFVIVVGVPQDDGSITADLIRIMPTSTASRP